MNALTYPGPRKAKPAFEPTLDEALSDPIVHLLLRRDKLNVNEVRSTLEQERERLLRRLHDAEPRPIGYR